jgi:hypothetical protein
LKLREKSDDDEKPQSKATSVSERPGSCDMRNSARSSRTRFTNWASVSPTSALNTRWKWNGEKPATRATSSRSSRWSRPWTTWSIARFTRST